MRIEDVYNRLKAHAGDTWIEPTFMIDEYVKRANHPVREWDFYPEGNREMEFFNKINDDFEKKLTIDIWPDDDEGGTGEDYVSYLRIYGHPRNHYETYNAERDKHIMVDQEEERWSLEEAWDWFVDPHLDSDYRSQ